MTCLICLSSSCDLLRNTLFNLLVVNKIKTGVHDLSSPDWMTNSESHTRADLF